MRGGVKKKTRRFFYRAVRKNREFLSVDGFYYIVKSLKPMHLNVKARRGRHVYTAPIAASSAKATMKAIKFFKKAVLSRKYEKNFFEKLDLELYEYFYKWAYNNQFYVDYTRESESTKYLRHFRTKRIY